MKEYGNDFFGKITDFFLNMKENGKPNSNFPNTDCNSKTEEVILLS